MRRAAIVIDRCWRGGVEIVSRLYPEQYARVLASRGSTGELRVSPLVQRMEQAQRRKRVRRVG